MEQSVQAQAFEERKARSNLVHAIATTAGATVQGADRCADIARRHLADIAAAELAADRAAEESRRTRADGRARHAFTRSGR